MLYASRGVWPFSHAKSLRDVVHLTPITHKADTWTVAQWCDKDVLPMKWSTFQGRGNDWSCIVFWSEGIETRAFIVSWACFADGFECEFYSLPKFSSMNVNCCLEQRRHFLFDYFLYRFPSCQFFILSAPFGFPVFQSLSLQNIPPNIRPNISSNIPSSTPSINSRITLPIN